jgi:hypothetical protein
MHIDTDEYIVPNPHLLKYKDIVERTRLDVRNAPEGGMLASDITTDPAGVTVPEQPTADSVLIFMRSMMTQFAHTHRFTHRNCLLIPRILFGSKETPVTVTVESQTNQTNTTNNNNNTTSETHVNGGKKVSTVPTHNNHSSDGHDDDDRHQSPRHFNTLRWTYSANIEDRYNGFPKSILNVATIPDHSQIFKEPRLIASVHFPLNDKWGEDCACYNGKFPFLPSEVDVADRVKNWKEQSSIITINNTLPSGLFNRPLIANHYLGSFKDYMSRDDARRTSSDYVQKARRGDKRKDDTGWMSTWLTHFVNIHGIEKVKSVLGHHDLSSIL